MSRNKSRILVLCGIFISRISGYIRDFAIAKYFGANIFTDAFINAFTIPNLLRGIFAEGNLSSAFIPVFNEELKKSKEQSVKFCRHVSGFMFFSTLIVTIIGIIFSFDIAGMIGHGFKNQSAKIYSGEYLRIMFPLLIFISSGALCMGALNSFNRFFITAIAPALINLCTIIAAVFFSNCFGQTDDRKLLALCWGTLAGSVIYFFFLAYPYIKAGYGFAFRFSFAYQPLKKFIKLILPSIPGQALYELNFLANRAIASYLGVGSISFLYFANRLYQFPLALFGIGVSTVMLPDAARAVNNSDEKLLISGYFDSLKYMFFFLCPITIFSIFFGGRIVGFVYQRGGQFCDKTTIAFVCYSIGLIVYAGANITSQIYYSMKDTLTPVKFSIINMLLNLALNIVIVLIWKNADTRFAGLALGNSLSGLIYFFLMSANLKFKLKNIRYTELSGYLFKIFLISLISCAAAFLLTNFINLNISNQILNSFALLSIPASILVICYFFLTLIFNIDLSIKIWYNIIKLIKFGNN